MRSAALEKLRSEALNLSEAERAELAHELVASLDGTIDSDAEEAWDAEIVRRLAEIDSGTAVLVDREEFRRRMRAWCRRKAWCKEAVSQAISVCCDRAGVPH